MKLLFGIFLILSAVNPSFSQQVCAAPDNKFAIFFVNGVDTSRGAAMRSLNRLRQELGEMHNNQAISFNLAYNQTSGYLWSDLVQAVTQAGMQWDSQLIGWFNGIGVAPDWFNNFYQKAALTGSEIIAPELEDHVSKYQAAILSGQKVLLISHSQGNFYANDAKKILLQTFTVEQMQGFTIFGVATPANNVGGNPQPYFNNHRDIIQKIPDALPTNWILHHANGQIADDISQIYAHSFSDAYMSSDFDIKSALLFGIKSQLNALKSPAPICDNYRKHFISQLAGNYAGICNGTKNTVTITKEASAIFPNLTVDLSNFDAHVTLTNTLQTTSALADNRGVYLNVNDSTGGGWNADGEFQGLESNKANMACSKSDTVPSSYLPNQVNIVAKASELLKGYRSGFPANKCALRNKETGEFKIPTRWQGVIVNGNIISVGQTAYDLAAERIEESVVIPSATFFSPADYESQFYLTLQFKNSDVLIIDYKAIKGLQSFQYVDQKNLFTCKI